METSKKKGNFLTKFNNNNSLLLWLQWLLKVSVPMRLQTSERFHLKCWAFATLRFHLNVSSFLLCFCRAAATLWWIGSASIANEAFAVRIGGFDWFQCKCRTRCKRAHAPTFGSLWSPNCHGLRRSVVLVFQPYVLEIKLPILGAMAATAIFMYFRLWKLCLYIRVAKFSVILIVGWYKVCKWVCTGYDGLSRKKTEEFS